MAQRNCKTLCTTFNPARYKDDAITLAELEYQQKLNPERTKSMILKGWIQAKAIALAKRGRRCPQKGESQ